MAYASGNLSTYETTGFTNNKAMFVAPSIKGSMVTASSWNAVGGDPASNDTTTSTTPASRAYDGLAAAQTTYNGNITVDSYFNIEMLATTLATFDVFGFINHNFKSDGVTDLFVDVADNQAFTENVKNIYKCEVDGLSGDIRNFGFNLNHATQTDTNKMCTTKGNTDVDVPSLANLRIGDLVSGSGIPSETYIVAMPDSTSITLSKSATSSLGSVQLTFSQFNYSSSGTAKQFSSVRYLRVRLTSGGATYSPKIGEFFFGTRYQLKANPNVPYDDKSYLSSVSDHLSTSGVRRRYVMNKGQGTRNINISTGDSDEISAIEDFWVASEYGTRSFVWVESPSSSPLSYLMNTEEPVLNFPLVGPIERNVAMVLLEQPPFKSSES